MRLKNGPIAAVSGVVLLAGATALAKLVKAGNLEAYRHLDMRFYNESPGSDLKEKFLALGFSDSEYEIIHNASLIIDGWRAFDEDLSSETFDALAYQIYQGLISSERYHQNPLFKKWAPNILDIAKSIHLIYSRDNNHGANNEEVADLERIIRKLTTQ